MTAANPIDSKIPTNVVIIRFIRYTSEYSAALELCSGSLRRRKGFCRLDVPNKKGPDPSNPFSPLRLHSVKRQICNADSDGDKTKEAHSRRYGVFHLNTINRFMCRAQNLVGGLLRCQRNSQQSDSQRNP